MKRILPSINRIFRKIIQSHPKYPKITILDLGCGKDSPIKDISCSFSVGVDIDKNYLGESKERETHSEYIEMDLTNLNIKELLKLNQNKKYDVVLFWGVIEHIKKRDGWKILKQMEN